MDAWCCVSPLSRRHVVAAHGRPSGEARLGIGLDGGPAVRQVAEAASRRGRCGGAVWARSGPRWAGRAATVPCALRLLVLRGGASVRQLRGRRWWVPGRRPLVVLGGGGRRGCLGQRDGRSWKCWCSCRRGARGAVRLRSGASTRCGAPGVRSTVSGPPTLVVWWWLAAAVGGAVPLATRGAGGHGVLQLRSCAGPRRGVQGPGAVSWRCGVAGQRRGRVRSFAALCMATARGGCAASAGRLRAVAGVVAPLPTPFSGGQAARRGRVHRHGVRAAAPCAVDVGFGRSGGRFVDLFGCAGPVCMLERWLFCW